MSSKETTNAERRWCVNAGAGEYYVGYDRPMEPHVPGFYVEEKNQAERAVEILNALERDLAAAQARVAELDMVLRERVDYIAGYEAEAIKVAARVAVLEGALVENCRGCQEGLPRLTPDGGVDYKYHDFGPTPRKDVTDSLGYDLEDYERLARYQVCDLSESQALALYRKDEGAEGHD